MLSSYDYYSSHRIHARTQCAPFPLPVEYTYHTVTMMECGNFYHKGSLYSTISWVGSGKCTVWVNNKFTLRKLSFILKVSYERKVIIYFLKECYIPNRLVSCLCVMCSRLDEQDALFVRVHKSTCAKVLKPTALLVATCSLYVGNNAYAVPVGPPWSSFSYFNWELMR